MDDKISSTDGRTAIGRLLNQKKAEREKLQRQIDIIDGEMQGLRDAEDAIASLASVKKAASKGLAEMVAADADRPVR